VIVYLSIQNKHIPAPAGNIPKYSRRLFPAGKNVRELSAAFSQPGKTSGSLPQTFPSREKRPGAFRSIFPAGKNVRELSADFSQPGKTSESFPQTFPSREKRPEAFRRLFPAGKNILRFQLTYY
jgi:hypothetical protein